MSGVARSGALSEGPRVRRCVRWLTSVLATALLVGGATVPFLAPQSAHALTTGDTVDLRVLLIGGAGGAASDPNTAAWATGLAKQGVAFTEVDAAGAIPSETVTLPTLTSSATQGLYNAVVFAGKPADFAAGQLTALFAYESTFGVRQLDGLFVAGYPSAGNLGLNAISDAQSGAAISSTTATLTAAGLAAFPALNGPVPIDVGSFGYSGTTTGVTLPTGASETPLLNDASGNVLIGVYQHPTAVQAPTDPQAGVAEMTVGINYNPNQTQWLLLGPGLIDWVTAGAHLGLYRNYASVQVDDVFNADVSWNPATHADDYSAADALRMGPVDVDNAATWSKANNFRFDALFSGGNSVAWQLAHGGTDALLAELQKDDPANGKPYSNDFGWLNNTWDQANLDTGCATTNYVEAEVQQNMLWASGAPGAAAGTGGLGLTSSTDSSLAYGTENPDALVPGGNSGLANLAGANGVVDPPNFTREIQNATGGTLAAGSYQWAVTDQFNAADSPTVDQSSASVTTPVAVTAGQTVSLQWQAVCHAANYLIYREVAGSNNWSLVGSVATPATVTPPASVSADPAGGSTTNTTGGGMQTQTFVDTGAAGTAQPVGWTPPTTQNAHELPWEQNPNFLTAMDALKITSVGTDATKSYPSPADTQFGIGVTYAGPTYPALASFVDGTFAGVPRHPLNMYYNNSTEAQAVDEYNTVYLAQASGGTCVNSATTTCLTTPATFAGIVNSVVSGMFTNMLNNDPRASYVHQSNIVGVPPAGPATTGTPPNTSTAVGDGLLYSVLNPLLAEYHTYYNATVPYEQPTMNAIGTVLNEQSGWATTQPAGTASPTNTVTANQTGAVITVTNHGLVPVTVPVTAPLGYEIGTVSFGTQYGGTLSGWQTVGAGQSIVIAIPPSVTSAATANTQVGSPFTFAVTTSGSPAPTLALSAGTLPPGLSYTPGPAAGTGTIAGAPLAGSGGTYPITFSATNIAGVFPQTFSLFVAQPSIALAPSTNPPSYAVAGTPITYNYRVTNTGNVSLAAIGVQDALPGLSTVSCPSTVLAAGANENCTAKYTATQADVDGGGIIDAATVTGTAASTTVVQASAGIATPAIQAPAIAVAPSTIPGGFVQAGTPITFDFLVTNSGDVTLHGVGVTDPLSGLSPIVCPNPTLAPAATETCAAGYTTTTADVSARGINHSATATGTPPSGVGVHGSSSVTVAIWTAPTITSAEVTSVPRLTEVNFDFTANGTPTPQLTLVGALPKGLVFTPGTGTALLSGTVNTGGTYTATLTATSPAGTTGQSINLQVTAPQIATSVTAQPGNKQATVGWVPPALHGGIPVTGYVVTPYIGHHALPSHVFNSSATHQLITGLSNGRQYSFEVAAMNKLGSGPNSVLTQQINALGIGPASSASPAIRVGAPTAPAVVNATATQGSLLVRFSGTSGNGSPIARFTATCTSTDGGRARAAVGTNGNAQSIVVTGVTPNKTYTCSVTATNKRGTGPATTSANVQG